MPILPHEFLENVRIADILDVCVITLIIYWVLQRLRQRASRAAAIGMLLMATVYVAAHLLGMYLTLFAFRIGFVAILIALVIVFQQDIRRGFERLSAWRMFQNYPRSLPDQTVDMLTEVIAALANEKIGALFVIEGRQPVEQHVRGGVPVSGQISFPLLHSIFHPASHGHDGAVLIEGDVISKLGVLLPLSKNLVGVGRFGTRHAAALGLAEHCDALTIAVSEEQGTISIAENSQLWQITSISELKKKLEAFYDHRYPVPKESLFARRLTANLGLKLLAAASACGLWFLFAYNVETVRRTIPDVPIEFRNLPDGWVVHYTDPHVAQVTLSGSERAFTAFDGADLKVSIDLGDVRGTSAVVITEEHVEIPDGLSIAQLEPSVVHVQTEPLVSVTLPVRIVLADPTILEKRHITAASQPSHVRLLVPRGARTSMTDIATEPIQTSSVAEGQTVKSKLVLPPGVKFHKGSPPQPIVRFYAKPGSPD